MIYGQPPAQMPNRTEAPQIVIGAKQVLGVMRDLVISTLN
jgi:hypothetical protein